MDLPPGAATVAATRLTRVIDLLKMGSHTHCPLAPRRQHFAAVHHPVLAAPHRVPSYRSRRGGLIGRRRGVSRDHWGRRACAAPFLDPTKMTQDPTRPRRTVPRPRTGISLFMRVFVTNATVLVIATALLVFTPATVSSPVSLGEVAVLLGGLIALMVVNLFLMRRTFAPLNRVRDLMGRFDPLQPGLRLPMEGLDSEVRDLTERFNEMAERLELERRQSAGRALDAQERERHRLAQELHDEIGQSLTGLLLLRRAPPARRRTRSVTASTRHSRRPAPDSKTCAGSCSS